MEVRSHCDPRRALGIHGQRRRSVQTYSTKGRRLSEPLVAVTVAGLVTSFAVLVFHTAAFSLLQGQSFWRFEARQKLLCDVGHHKLLRTPCRGIPPDARSAFADAPQVGQLVQARWDEDGCVYSATVLENHGDGTYTIRWDEYGTTSRCQADEVMLVRRRRPVSELQVGERLLGKVEKVVPYGAFIDVGVEVDGLVPLSKMSGDGSARPEELAPLHHQVVVWVSNVRDDGALELSMVEDLIGEQPRNPSGIPIADLEKGQNLQGIVVKLVPYGAFVDVGAERNGLVPLSKMADGYVRRAEEIVDVGQEVEVWVSRIKDSSNLELSMVESRIGNEEQRSPVVRLRDLKIGQQLTGKVTKVLPYGAFVDVGAARKGLVPKSKMPAAANLSVEEIVSEGQQVTVWVSRIKQGEALELSMVEPELAKEDVSIPVVSIEELSVGQSLSGKVVKVVAYGLFIEVGAERTGLVPVSRFVSNGGVPQVGEHVQVWVSCIKENGALELSMVELDAEAAAAAALAEFMRPAAGPSFEVGELVRGRWEDSSWYRAWVLQDHNNGSCTIRWEDYNIEQTCDVEDLRKVKEGRPVSELSRGDKLQGTVAKLMPYGAFIDIGAEVDGLVPLSEIHKDKTEHPADRLALGQEVAVWIKAIRKDGMLKLSMRERRRNKKKRDLNAFKHVAPTQWLKGTVTSVKDFGAFVTVEPPGGEEPQEGLVHMSAISSRYVVDPRDEVEVGQEVEVRVIGLGLEVGRMHLSMVDPVEE